MVVVKKYAGLAIFAGGLIFSSLSFEGCNEFICEEYGDEIGQCLDEDFVFRNADGENVSLYESRRKVTLMNVSAGFCENCHEEAEDLPDLYKRYEGLGLAIYQPMVTGVFAWVEPDEEFLDYFRDEYGIEHVLVMDPELETLYSLGIGSVPINVFFYDYPGEGMYIENIVVGYDKSYIEQQIEEMVVR